MGSQQGRGQARQSHKCSKSSSTVSSINQQGAGQAKAHRNIRYVFAGILGRLPAVRELRAGGVRAFEVNGDTADQSAIDAEDVGARDRELPALPVEPPLCLWPGLPPIPAKVVDRIRANAYIDFSDLPPAKGKGKPVTHALEGQVIVVQAADLMQSRRIIPDLATWSQCYAVYVAVLATAQPERLPDLMAYFSLIARASLKYRWLSWVVYDQNFR